MKTTSFAIVSSLLSLTLASPALERKAACNANNCARAVTGTVMGTATRAARLADCSSYQACTVTPAASTVTVTVTPSPVYVYTGTDVVVFTSTATVVAAAANKRAASAAGPVTSCPTALPAYASSVCAAPAAFASACSCAGVTRSTTTATTPTSTVTQTAAPQTVYAATTVSSAVVQTATVAPPDCTSFPEVLDGPDQPVTYNQYFAGSGVTENSRNPGNNFNPPITITTGGSKCEAAAYCARYGSYAEYYSFDLHFLKSQNQWECVLYFDSNSNPSYFNVANSNVGAAYGYSI